MRSVEKSSAGARTTRLLAGLRELEGTRGGAAAAAAARASGGLTVVSEGTERKAASAFVLDCRAARENVDGVLRPLISLPTGAMCELEPDRLSSSLETPVEALDDSRGRGGGRIEGGKDW